MPGCLSVAEVHQALGLDALKNRTFQIFKTSAKKGEGLDEAMDWLANALQSKKWFHIYEERRKEKNNILSGEKKNVYLKLPLKCFYWQMGKYESERKRDENFIY